MTNPALDAETVKHLALIRLLYLQGADQARQPQPLSLFSLLTFHDSVELFLVLAADHLGAQMPQRDPGFLDYWHLLRPTNTFPSGVNLTGRGRMDRLNRNRNALKHAGAFPSQEIISDALRATESFFEDNTEKVFGVAFDAIDMADIVPQDDIRALLKSAAKAEAAGDRTEAMADLAEAFAKLFRPLAGPRYSAYSFGETVPDGFTSKPGLEAAMHAISSQVRSNATQNVGRVGRKADESIAKLDDAVSALQRGMRVLATGIDYAQYNRFEQLTQHVQRTRDGKATGNFGYAPDSGEYAFCTQFVITSALRIAELAAHSAQPSWLVAQGWAAPRT